LEISPKKTIWSSKKQLPDRMDPPKTSKYPSRSRKKLTGTPTIYLSIASSGCQRWKIYFFRVLKPENLTVKVIFVTVAAILVRADNFFHNTWYLKKLKWYKTVGIGVFFMGFMIFSFLASRGVPLP
jgi:hypothetical protein